MEQQYTRKKLIYTLVIFILALVIANVFMSSVQPVAETKIKLSTSSFQIDSVFNSTVNTFGLNISNLKKYKIKKNLYDSLKVKYKLYLPSDIPTIEFISELNKQLSFDDVKLTADEKKINGDSELKIFSDNILKFNAVLVREMETKREFGSFTFLITDAAELSKENAEELLLSPFPFGILVNPSSEIKTLITQTIKAGKEFSLLLDDEISEEIFRLDIEYGKRRLKNSVINIRKNFGEAENIYIDKNTELYKAPVYSYIREQFVKRGVILKAVNSIKILEAESNEDLLSLLDFYFESLGSNDKEIFLISAEDFLIIQSGLNKISKKGIGIILPSEIKIN